MTLNLDQVEALLKLLEDESFWTGENNCTKWAADVFEKVTGQKIDASDPNFGGFFTPKRLAELLEQLRKEEEKKASDCDEKK